MIMIYMISKHSLKLNDYFCLLLFPGLGSSFGSQWQAVHLDLSKLVFG
jgi:hypothetical protein